MRLEEHSEYAIVTITISFRLRLRHVLSSMGKKLTDNVVDEKIGEPDQYGYGSINYNAFVQLMKKQAASFEKAVNKGIESDKNHPSTDLVRKLMRDTGKMR